MAQLPRDPPPPRGNPPPPRGNPPPRNPPPRRNRVNPFVQLGSAVAVAVATGTAAALRLTARVTIRAAVGGVRAASALLATTVRSAAEAIEARTQGEDDDEASSEGAPTLPPRDRPRRRAHFQEGMNDNFQPRRNADIPHIRYPMEPHWDAPAGQHHPAGGKYYVVFRGTKTGIFNSWHEASRHCIGVDGAIFEGFRYLGDAQTAYNEALRLGNVGIIDIGPAHASGSGTNHHAEDREEDRDDEE